MPNPPAPKTERAFCTNCGFPLRGSRCDACGSAQDAVPAWDSGDDSPTKQTQFRPYAPEVEGDVAGLERAIEAFRAKDTVRFIEHVVVAEGMGSARTAHSPEGSAWIVVVRGSVLFITLRAPQDEVVIEAPVARLPSRQRLPAMRLALELSMRDAVAARLALRGDMLLLRLSARASLVTPALLRSTLRELGHLASRYAGLFVVGLDALPAIADDQRASASFEVLGRAKKVQLGQGGSVRRSIPPPVPAPARPSTSPRAMRREESSVDGPADPIPAILSPAFSSVSSAGSSAGQAPLMPAIPPPPPAPKMPSMESREARDVRGPRSTTSPTGAMPERRPAISGAPAQRERAPEVEIDALSRRPDPGSSPGISAPSGPSGAPALSPSDKLCMLLRQAQSLASIALEERPATMMWLVRSTVFRAVYEFKDTVPDAVSHLYRCTGAGRDAATTRTSSSNMPALEPAVHVMERVIVARGQMPKEKALALEPMVTAAQAKEHVARYLAEIDRAPLDPSVRHYLALGALTELLVRTKLPPQTDQRLRDIVAHAQREGAKGTAIDLMMTALQRINS